MNTFKNTTGLLQEEIAFFLNITRTQWSMFAIGKRGLPVEATLKLCALLEYLQKNNFNKKSEVIIERENKIAKDELKKKLLDLEIMLHQINQKINEMIKNRHQLFLAMSSMDYLKTHKQTDTSWIVLIEKRINKGLVNNSLKNLESLELKKQQIENDIDTIKKRLRDSFK